MFDQAFNAIDNALRTEAGCTTELDYTEQTSWLLFLRYLDGLEQDKATEAQLEGKRYSYILEKPYRWETWAAPKNKAGELDHNAAMTGDDLVEFVNDTLFPYLRKFTQKASGPDTIEYKIGEVFGEIKNKITSGYTLREIIDAIDGLKFRSQVEKHELSQIYEEKIKRMGNAGRNGGEYYTPRPLIRAMIKVVDPKIGETVYDPACGSAGFLCETYDYLYTKGITTKDARILQEKTFTGKEKKSLAYVIAIMNLILHGVEAPRILHVNTLTENLADVQEKDRFNIILANPPFGGSERKEVQQNFPIRTGETAYLFLQHFIKMLKAGGRAGVVIKNTFLSNTDNASVSLRKMLLESCNLHTVLDCPKGTFLGTTTGTVVLFFEKGAPTRKVWYYQLDPGRTMGKTSPLNDDDLAEFVKLQKGKKDSDKSWSVDVKTLDETTFDLSVKNPNGGEEVAHRSPEEILDEIASLDVESADVLAGLRGVAVMGGGPVKPLGDLVDFQRGLTYSKGDEVETSDNVVLRATNIDLNTNLLDLSELRYISDKFVVPATKKIRKHSLIICTASGSKAHLGKVAYVDDDYGYAFGGFMGMLTPRSGLLPRYLFHLMTSDGYKAFIAALSDGANINNLKFDDLSRFPVPVPPLAEQQRVVNVLDEAFAETQRLQSNSNRRLAALDALKASLLHHAFTGQLRNAAPSNALAEA